MNIQARVTLVDEPGNLKGRASISFDDMFVVKGFRIYNSENGLFVSMPTVKTANGYQNSCYPLTLECRKQIEDVVLKTYEQKLQEWAERIPEEQRVVEEQKTEPQDELVMGM